MYITVTLYVVSVGINDDVDVVFFNELKENFGFIEGTKNVRAMYG
jgi:hypothetical protein